MNWSDHGSVNLRPRRRDENFLTPESRKLTPLIPAPVGGLRGIKPEWLNQRLPFMLLLQIGLIIFRLLRFQRQPNPDPIPGFHVRPGIAIKVSHTGCMKHDSAQPAAAVVPTSLRHGRRLPIDPVLLGRPNECVDVLSSGFLWPGSEI